MNLDHSSASRWVKCNAAPSMESRGVARLDRDASDEGILAHRTAAAYLLGGVNADLNDCDMNAGASLYRHAINLQLHGRYALLHVEDRIDAIPNNVGVIDAWFIDGNTLYLYDYKYGHKLVDAYQNWQLINNAAALEAMHLAFDFIEMTVVQPRAWSPDGPVRTWKVTRAEIGPFFAQIHGARERALSDKPLAVTGSHCYKCSAAAHCGALRQIGWSATELATLESEHILPDDVIGSELRILEDHEEMLKARIDGLRTDLEHRIRSGSRIAGYDIVPTTSALKWSMSIDEVLLMADMLGVDIRKPPEAMTPTQVLAANKMDPDLVKGITAKSSTGTKLTRLSGHKFSKIFS